MSAAMLVAGIVLGTLACLLLVPAIVFASEIVAAVWRRGAALASGATEEAAADAADAVHAVHAAERPRPRLAVLMPAHDESAGIAASIASVLAQLRAGDRLLVVADNCSDDTFLVARAAGAEAIERHDPARRGKGYALDHGVRHLEADPPAVVVVLDADCLLQAASLDRLARLADRIRQPVQAHSLMQSPPNAGLKTRMAEFAWIVKNRVRPFGLLRLGLPCQLMGTGMALPWSLVRTASLASGHLVEDLQLGLDLAAAGAPPRLCPEAIVTSMFPVRAEGVAAQRTRWEHGHLSVIAGSGPRLLLRSLATGRVGLLAMVLDLCVPPLASLVLAVVAVAVLSALLSFLGGSAWPLCLALASLVAITGAVLLAWHGHGRDVLTLRELLFAPGYALRKLPFYLRMLGKHQPTWVRADRGDAPQEASDHAGPRR